MLLLLCVTTVLVAWAGLSVNMMHSVTVFKQSGKMRETVN
jgi:hypothetical protein